MNTFLFLLVFYLEGGEVFSPLGNTLFQVGHGFNVEIDSFRMLYFLEDKSVTGFRPCVRDTPKVLIYPLFLLSAF